MTDYAKLQLSNAVLLVLLMLVSLAAEGYRQEIYLLSAASLLGGAALAFADWRTRRLAGRPTPLQVAKHVSIGAVVGGTLAALLIAVTTTTSGAAEYAIVGLSFGAVVGVAYAVAAFLVVRNGDPQRGAAETRATPGMSRDTTAWPGDGATGTAGGARGRVERECPWCAEPILAKARACKHCLRQVEPLVHPEA